MRGVWLFLLIITPIPVVGQFILPFLYVPLKRIFKGDFGDEAKYDKVTIHHVRTEKNWTLEFTYSENLDNIKSAVFSFTTSSFFTAADLENLDYYWSYSIPFNELDSNYSDHLFAAAKTPADYQKELLTFVSQRFVFELDKVASNLEIPTTNLSSSYDPANWETVVHAMVNESSSAFSRLLELPTVDALAELMDIEVQDFLNVNLTRFEKMVFPFLPKKAILDKNSTSSLINNSRILPGESYNDMTLAKILQHHEKISLSTREFGILYNLTREQAKAIGRSTFYQIFRKCGISIETLLSITLPEVSWKVVGSLYILPPCPVLISIKGKSIESFKSSVNILNASVLEILTDVSNLTWRQVYESVNVSLPDWEFLDSVTLPQLSEIGEVSLETLLNDSVSEAVVLLLKLRADGSLINKTENHRLFVRTLLRETFNLSLSDVANLTALSEASLQGASSPLLFRRFLNATIANFRLNLSDIFFSLQLSEETLYNLPKQEWKSVIVTIVDSVVQSESRDLQTSTENLLTFLGVQSVELSIAKLKELIENQILDAKRHKKKFETAPIIMYLSQNAVSDDAYLNSFVLSLVLSASGFNSSELNLLYGYNSEQRFILQSLRIYDLPLYCTLNTSTVKNKTPLNITAELVGTREVAPVCTSTGFYVSARTKNMSQLKSEFSLFTNSSVSFVTLVEKVTGLPWRRNVWAFGLKMEDWIVLYVLNEGSYKEVTSSLQLDPYLSTALLKILQKSVELKDADNVDIWAKIIEHRNGTLNFLYNLFNTNRAELMHFGSKSKAQYDVLFPIEVFALTIQYLVDKFNVSVSRIEVSLDLNPGELEKLSPTEWREMIPFVKNEIIRSGENQLGVSMKNFAQLLQEKPENLQNVSLAQLESKWDSMFSRLLRGKEAIETETLLQIITAIGITSGSIDGVTFLKFIEEKINISISEVLLLYNYSSIGIDVLGNYTILETRGFCNLSEGNFLSKRPQDLIESLLGVDNEMSCRKIALVVAASTLTVNDLASKFSLEVADNVSLLTMFEDLFKLPWPKIAWAVNASLPDWPILGAINLNTVGQLVSKTAAIMKSQESFREITMQLLSLSKNSYSQLLDEYRAKIVSKAGELFSVNSSRICDNCDVEDILWNSLRQLNQLIDFDPQMLPNQLNVSPYEFNLTVPSHWSVMVQHIVRDSYSRVTVALGMDRDRLSSFLRTSTEIVENMTLHQYQAVFTQSIQPLIVAKTALNNSPLLDLVAAKGLNLSNLYHESIFNVIDAILNISAQNASFIFNWTTEQQAKLKNYTLDDLSYYKGVSFHDLGSERPLSLVEFTIQQLFTPRTIAPPTLLPCKRGTVRSGNDANCSDVDECATKQCGDDSLCQNYHGGYDCDCNAIGYYKVNNKGDCKPSKTFAAKITIENWVYQSNYNIKSAGDFYDLKEMFEETVNGKFKESSVGQYYYGCRVQDFSNGSIIVDFLIYTSRDFTGTLQDLRDALASVLNNSFLGPFEVSAAKIAVDDFDECKTHQDNCAQHATCINKDGSFECQCNDGYDGDGLICEAGFFKTMWWTVIVAAFLLLLMVIIVVCLVIKRPKPSSRYGLDMDDPAQRNIPYRRRQSEASKISYRSGDVYFKDKEGKLRSGTAHTPHNLESANKVEQRPQMPHFVAEDDLQHNNSVRPKTPFELAVERNTRSAAFKSSYALESKTPFELAVERNARNGNVYGQREDLNMTELPYASIKN